MEPMLTARRVVISAGTYTPKGRGSKKVEQRVEWSLAAVDCDPWRVQGTPCKSNVRLVQTKHSRKPGCQRSDGSPEVREGLPHKNRTGRGRFDLRLTIQPFGRIYLHVLAWWLFYGRHLKRFRGNFALFKNCDEQVDHGSDGMPHILDYRKLSLSDREDNAGQGAGLRWGTYAGQGGLADVVAKGVKRKR